MKINFKSILATLLALVLLLTVVGCGAKDTQSEDAGANDDFFGIQEEINNTDGGSQDGEGDSSGSGQGDGGQSGISSTGKTGGKAWKDVLASMPKELRGTTLNFYNWNPMNEYLGASAAIKKFEKATGIKVKWNVVAFDNFQTQISAAIAAGDPNTAPDIVRIRTANPVPLQSLQPITNTGYDFNDDAWNKEIMEHFTYNGKTYGVALQNTHLGTVNILMYNTSLVDQYDLEDPYQLWKNGKWTWSKFIEISKQFKKASNKPYAFASNLWEPWFQIHGISAPVVLQNGKFVNISTSSEFVNIAQKLSDTFISEQLFAPELQSTAFNNGDILFFGHSALFARSKNAYFPSLKEAGSLSAVPFPAVDGQSKYYVGSGEFEAYGIANGAKNPKAAPYFLRYFLDAENYDMKAFFTSAQVLEVYNWSMKQEMIPSICFSGDPWYGETYDQGYLEKLHKTSSSQMKSFLESNSPIVDARANELNTAISKLK